MFKSSNKFPKLSEDQFMDNLRALRNEIAVMPYNTLAQFKQDLIVRLSGVMAAAHYIHKFKGTDDVEYRAFLNGLNHAIEAIRKAQT